MAGEEDDPVARRLPRAVAACVIIAIIALPAWWVERSYRHNQFCRTTRAELETLARKRPPGVTRDQWKQVVGWTLNAHGNTLPFRMLIPRAEMARFETELRERLSGPVDLNTVDWIWDEFVRLCGDGARRYSDNWRPTRAGRLREPEKGYNPGHFEMEVD